ncbi:MAG: hypothetical protein ACO1Q7_17675 [Gemmatimonas sp.]
MTTTLPLARETFITAMNRETGMTDRPRYLAVLDALIEWSLARPDQLVFRTDESVRGALSFCRVGSNVVFWSVKPTRADGALIELLPRANAILSEQDRNETREALNLMSREVLEGNDRLRVGFSAMKNPKSRDAMFTLMDHLVTKVA